VAAAVAAAVAGGDRLVWLLVAPAALLVIAYGALLLRGPFDTPEAWARR
jgi:hypothetical protein